MPLSIQKFLPRAQAAAVQAFTSGQCSAMKASCDYALAGGVPGADGPPINWATATAMLAAPAGQGLSPTAYSALQFLGANAALRQGLISSAVYKVLTSMDVPPDLRSAAANGLEFNTPWTVTPALAVGAAGGVNASLLAASALAPFSIVQPATFQVMNFEVEMGARVVADSDTLALAIPNTQGGMILPVADWDNTTLGSVDAQRNRAVVVQGNLVRSATSAGAQEAIAVGTFAHRYKVKFAIIQ